MTIGSPTNAASSEAINMQYLMRMRPIPAGSTPAVASCMPSTRTVRSPSIILPGVMPREPSPTASTATASSAIMAVTVMSWLIRAATPAHATTNPKSMKEASHCLAASAGRKRVIGVEAVIITPL